LKLKVAFGIAGKVKVARKVGVQHKLLQPPRPSIKQKINTKLFQQPREGRKEKRKKEKRRVIENSQFHNFSSR
jgi:hypothetical protein